MVLKHSPTITDELSHEYRTGTDRMMRKRPTVPMVIVGMVYFLVLIIGILGAAALYYWVL